MDKRNRRTHTKMENIKRTALELFTMHGVDRVSMDEIAAKANVSKVTIYKYFGSKEDLYAEVINLFLEETIAAAEAILNSDMDFLEKLKFPFQTQTHSAQLVNTNQLFQIWDADPQIPAAMNETLQNTIKALVYRVYEEGRKKGYIDETISFETLYLYIDIFRAGLRAKAADADNPETMESIYDLFFFGFINRK